MSEIIYLTRVRLSFPTLIEPKGAINDPNAKVKYSADLLMEPSHKDFVKFMQEVHRTAGDKWGGDAENVLNMINIDRKLRCYGKGEERIDKKTFKPYVGYEGNVYISASRELAPQMIGGDGNTIDGTNAIAYRAAARTLYGGCSVNAAVRPWLQENKHGRGVRCDLVAIQFCEDGEAFGEGNADVSGMFTPVATSAAPQFGAPAAPQWGMPTPPFAT